MKIKRFLALLISALLLFSLAGCGGGSGGGNSKSGPVNYKNSIAGGDKYVLVLQPEGKVAVFGEASAEFKQEVEAWEDVIAVYASTMYEKGVAAIQSDGNILFYPSDARPVKINEGDKVKDVYSQFGRMVVLKADGSIASDWPINVSDKSNTWTDIDKVSGSFDTLIGIKKDGTFNIQYTDESIPELEKMTNVKDIKQLTSHGWVVLKTDGTIAIIPDEDADDYDLAPLEEAATWTDIEQIVVKHGMILGLGKDGTVKGVGDGIVEIDWDKQDDSKLREWTDIVAIDNSYFAVFGVKKDGTLVFATDDMNLDKFEGLNGLKVEPCGN